MMTLVLVLHVILGSSALGSAALSFVSRRSAAVFVPSLIGTAVSGGVLLTVTPTLGASCVRLIALTGAAVLVRASALKYAKN